MRAVAPEDAPTERTLSRRQALGHMSVLATAGAAAWVIPEIMTAKPAEGASLSLARGGGGGGGGDGGGDGGGGYGDGVGGDGDGTPGVTTPPGQLASGPAPGPTTSSSTTAAPAAPPAGTLAFTGTDLQRDAEIGAALVAGGWVMHHWASRTPKAAAEAVRRKSKAGRPDTPPT